MPEAEALCDEIAFLRDEKILATGTPGELKRRVGFADVIRVAGTGTFPIDAVRSLPGVLAVHEDGGDPTRQELLDQVQDRRRLAAPRLPHERQGLAGGDGHRHAIHGPHVARDPREDPPPDREVLPEVPDLEERPRVAATLLAASAAVFAQAASAPSSPAKKELVAKVTANEPGCTLYALHHGETPGTYVFLERYVDQAAVDAHRATDYFKTLGRKMGEYMDGRPEVVRLREVE